ncbi:MAG: aminotransferase class V-fold PLP-dependent enzyme [Ardenticatenaceae bacterium]|nr:aminotransferase class V-fold PLP-dependent enzyme [Ardenticatenaceae bacterium]
MSNLKEQFLLSPDVIYLNHGSFGATPRPVFETYQTWQRQLENQPVQFIDKELPVQLANARQRLGNYLNVDSKDLVYVPNATFALNIVARSLKLAPGDEVLTTNIEYGACNNVWQFLSQKRGFLYLQQKMPFPFQSDQTVIDQLWQGVTANTKVIFISHITSSTAVTFPVEAICQRAKEEGILTIVDGAHAPGQIELDLEKIGADFYFGNAHKWMCSPKGSAFLYTRQERQNLLEPLVVGWGWGENRVFTFGSDYLDYFQWLGTNDVSAYLSVPAAIEFQTQNNWPGIRQQCHALLKNILARINQLTGLPSPYPDDLYYHQMAVAQLPPITDLKAFKSQLYEDFRIEVPCTQWEDKQFIRVSIQAYNTEADGDALINALKSLLPTYCA